jgi:hypothetical protein
MLWMRKSWVVGALLAVSPLVACSGTDQLVGSDGSTGGATGGSAGASGSGESAGSYVGSGTAGSAALGEPCLPRDEYVANFAGFDGKEINIDDKEPACASQVCVVNHFQGRVSCPYGQTAGGEGCLVPGSDTPVSVPVQPQLQSRQAATASICSCQCAGYGPGPYCSCPTSMQCEHLVDFIVGVPGTLDPYSGSYCIPADSQYDSKQLSTPCVEPNCGDAHPY